MTPLSAVCFIRFFICLGYLNVCEINCLVVIKTDFFHARSEKVQKDKKREVDKVCVCVCVYLSDIRQLQDVREDIEAWGLQ